MVGVRSEASPSGDFARMAANETSMKLPSWKLDWGVIDFRSNARFFSIRA